MLDIIVQNWISLGDGYYVWHDGTIRQGATGGVEKEMYNRGWWHTKEEAEKFLREWLPQSPWLDKEAVKLAAKRSDISALLSSITHWRQIVVNWDRYFKDKYTKVNIDTSHCALCQRFFNSSNCPLKNNSYCSGKCIPEWTAFHKEETLENAIAMHNKLVVLLNQISMLKKEQPKKVEFRPGDIVKGQWGVRLIVRIKKELHAVDKFGCMCATGQAQFEELNYEKIGTCNGFILK